MRPIDEFPDLLLVVLERTTSLSRLLDAHWRCRRDCADRGLPQPLEQVITAHIVAEHF